MRIRTQLRLSILASVIIIFVVGLITLFTFQKVNEAGRNNMLSNSIVKGVFELNLLTSDYLLHPGERARIQWQQKCDALGSLLAELRFRDLTRPVILQSILESHQRIKILFTQWTLVYKRSSLEGEETTSPKLQERLVSQLLVTSQDMVSRTSRLAQLTQENSLLTRRRADFYIMVLMTALVAIITVNSFLTARNILQPITQLHEGTEIVGTGNLEFKVATGTKDEIGQFSQAFDQMTERLKAVTVSRDELAREVTQRKQAEERIQELNRELEERLSELTAAHKELESFSYSVSHDLRAPLRGIDGFSRIVLEDYGSKLDSEGKRLLKVVRDNTQKMGQLIDDLLTFSRRGRQRINESTINMQKLAQDVFEEIGQTTSERQLKLKITALPLAWGDRPMIREVWVNLLSNAIKFTKYQKRARVEVSGKVENKENIYSVKDNGVGFDMQYVNKLFGVFQRLHSEKEFKGTGVGLALVQRIIRRHGGRAWAEGKVDEGATFYFALPRDKEES